MHLRISSHHEFILVALLCKAHRYLPLLRQEAAVTITRRLSCSPLHHFLTPSPELSRLSTKLPIALSPLRSPTMSHFPRFRRKKEDATAAPTILTSVEAEPSEKASPPGDLQPAAPARRGPRLSPLHHVFHRGSGKRARDSPVGSDVSPTSSVAPPAYHAPAAQQAPQPVPRDSAAVRKVKMPAFLSSTPQGTKDADSSG